MCYFYGLPLEAFFRNGDTIPPLTTDTSRWKLLIVNNEQFLTAHLMNDTIQILRVKTDTTRKSFSWTMPSNPSKSSRFTYRQPDKYHLTLQGHLLQDSVQIHLIKLNLEKLPLLNRGFHWVNEYPYNR